MKETLKTLIRYIIGDTKKNSPRDKKKFHKPCKILTKKKMDEKEKMERLKTLIRYIIGDLGYAQIQNSYFFEY